MVEPGLDNFLCEFCIRGFVSNSCEYLISVVLVPQEKERQKESSVYYINNREKGKSIHFSYRLLNNTLPCN